MILGTLVKLDHWCKLQWFLTVRDCRYINNKIYLVSRIFGETLSKRAITAQQMFVDLSHWCYRKCPLEYCQVLEWYTLTQTSNFSKFSACFSLLSYLHRYFIIGNNNIYIYILNVDNNKLITHTHTQKKTTRLFQTTVAKTSQLLCNMDIKIIGDVNNMIFLVHLKANSGLRHSWLNMLPVLLILFYHYYYYYCFFLFYFDCM